MSKKNLENSHAGIRLKQRYGLILTRELRNRIVGKINQQPDYHYTTQKGKNYFVFLEEINDVVVVCYNRRLNQLITFFPLEWALDFEKVEFDVTKMIKNKVNSLKGM